MAGNYRCTNVKFNMDDVRQRKAYQILQKIKGRYSYGVIIADALIRTYRDADRPSNEIDGDGTIIPNNYFSINSSGLDRFAELIVEKMMSTDTMKDLVENMDDLTDDMICFYGYGRTEEGLKRQEEASVAGDCDVESKVRAEADVIGEASEGTAINADANDEIEPAEITDAMLSFACG
ncbi:MAG: hypothetical protein IJ058_03820 [Lachnospiraceae bacterium]|nr:hypothetical protein [Lachnospiraceae bacterium]